MGKIFFPQFRQGREGTPIHPGLSLLEAARIAGVRIYAECAGTGKCGKCGVRIPCGIENLNQLTGIEKQFRLKENERLACQARVIRDTSDITVYIKNFGEYEILKHATERTVALSPAFLRHKNRVIKDGKPVGHYRGGIYGIAADIGTTTAVMELVDLETGDTLETFAATNPQISFGNDVISRIDFASSPENLKELQKLSTGLINGFIRSFDEETGKNISESVYSAVIAGNPAMRDIFFGIDVSSLGKSPYEPADSGELLSAPGETGICMNKRGEIYGVPLIGGYVGGDIVAGILACGMHKSEDICMFIDIGTNGEIAVGNKNRMIAASCAAGGAFEGATVPCGSGSIEGAIRKVEILNGRIAYSTIGNKYPEGICGSGFIDLLAEMLEHGIMSENARIKEDFYITGDIKITQQDIFQLITSKAAFKTGWQILLKEFPAELSGIKKIYISGGFGNYINEKNAAKIGVIPPIEGIIAEKIGNGSLEGAREILLNSQAREEAGLISKNVVHIKLNEAAKNFDLLLAENMYF